MRRSLLLRLLLPGLALLVAVIVMAAPASRAPRVPKPADPNLAPPQPSVELIESVPVESALGNPRLRAAAVVWVELIRTATARIDLEQFYVSTWPGEPMEPVLAALVEAAKRGVRVRLLIDSRMHRTYPQPADSLGLIPGITVRTIDMGKISGGVQHSKYFLIDGQTAYVGSQNFDWRALKQIHELGVCVRDERVTARLQQVFDMDWATAELQASSADSSRIVGWPAQESLGGGLPVRVVQSAGDTVEVWPSWSPHAFSPDSMLWDRDAIVQRIDEARDEVVVQSMKYSTLDRGLSDDALDVALRRAAGRGVRVKVLISDWQAGGESLRDLDSLATVPGIEVRLSSVPEWSEAYIPFARVEHCKYMVVDTLVTWIGTSNWEPSYFHTTRNVAFTLRNRPLAGEAREIFRVSWDASESQPVGHGRVYPARRHGADAPAGVTKYGN